MMKIFFGFIITVISLIIIVLILIQIPFVQNKIKDKFLGNLSAKMKTELKIGYLHFSLSGKIIINDVYAGSQQKDTIISVSKLRVGFDPTALLNKKIVVSSVSIEKAKINYLVYDTTGKTNFTFLPQKEKTEPDTKEKTKQSQDPWHIVLQKAIIKKTDIYYNSTPDGKIYNISAGFIEVKAPESDLILKKFLASSVYLENVHVALITYAKAFTKTEEKKDTSAGELTLGLDRFVANNISLKMTDSTTGSNSYFRVDSADITPETIDINGRNIIIQNIELNHGSVVYTLARKTTKNKPASEKNDQKEQQEWSIALVKSSLSLDSIKLNKYVFNSLQNVFTLNHFELDFGGEFNSASNWQGDINNMSFTDEKTGKHLNLSTNAIAKNNKIFARFLNLDFGKSFIRLNAELQQTLNKTHTVPDFRLNIDSAYIQKNDIIAYLPIKSDSVIPSEITFTAKAFSEHGQTIAEGFFNTEYGNINYRAGLNQDGDFASSSYFANIQLNNVNPGKYLNNPVLGPVDGIIELAGKGTSIYSVSAETKVILNSVFLKSRTFRNIELYGKIDKGKVDAVFSLNDSAAKVKLLVNGNLSANREINAKLSINQLDMEKAGIMKDTISLTGYINATYKSNGPEQLSIRMDTFNLTVNTPRDILPIQSTFNYSVDSDIVDADFNSSLGDFAYYGNQNIGAISKIIESYTKRYFSKTSIEDTLKNAFFVFTFEFEDLSLLKDFLPLKIATPEKVYAEAKLENNSLTGLVDLKKIIIPGLEADSFRIKANGEDSSFNFNLEVGTFIAGNHSIKNINLEGNLSNGNLDSRFSFEDNKERKWFDIGFTLQPQNPDLNLSILAPLMLNYQLWTVDTTNMVTLPNNKIAFKNFIFENSGRQLKFYNNPGNIDEINFDFRDLNLNFFSALLVGDTTSISGKIGGNISVLNTGGEGIPVFNSKIHFSDIISSYENLGDLFVNVSNTNNRNQIDANINLGSDIKTFVLNGSYKLKDEKPFDINLSISKLNLAAFAPFISNFITSPEGEINSNLRLSGSIKKPRINGEISFTGLSAFVSQAGTTYKIDKQRINFIGNRIEFPSFTILDATNNPLSINGNVNFDSISSFNYDLTINSKKFLAFIGENENPSVTGNKVITSSTIRLVSEKLIPVVNANIQIDEGSSFFYSISRRSAGISEEGLIEFIGPEEDTTVSQKIPLTQNLNITANIVIAEKTPITIITDPARRIGLNINAGGTFSFIQRPLQAPRLIGKILVSGGDYTIVLTGIKRTFTLSDSSTIAWYGDIANPELNLKAIYQVRTSPAELVADQPVQYSTLPFNVNMIISGGLSNPSFKFNLSMPEEYQGAYNGLVASKLQEINANESDLNQKAMMLILFGSFGFADIRSIFSTGQDKTNLFISNALNQFAQQKIKFVDLHFDLQSYDDYGGVTGGYQRTQLTVGASKKFIDNKLDTRLGATFIIQGDESEQRRSFINRTIPEYNIQYMLNKPRTLSVKTFRSSDYRGLIEGRVISTGVGLVFQKDFDSLPEFLKRASLKDLIR